MNKKADLTGAIYMIAMVAALAIFLIVVGYIGSTVGTALKTQLNSTDDGINNAFDTTISVSENVLPAVWYIVFAGLLFGLFITAWFMQTKPIFVPIFIILLLVSILVGVAMSNAYEAIADTATFSTIASTQGGIDFMMSKLPYVAFIVGLIALIITYSKPGEQGYATSPM